MRIVYIQNGYFPYEMKGSEVLNSIYTDEVIKNNEVYCIASNLVKPIGKFIPFIGRTKEIYEKVDGVNVIRLDFFFLPYVFSQIISKIPDVPYMPLLKKIKNKVFIYSQGFKYIGLEKTLRRINPDIVHTTPLSCIYSYQALDVVNRINSERNKCNKENNSEKKIKIVLTTAFHSNILKSFDEEYIKKRLKEFSLIITSTLAEKEKLAKYFDVDATVYMPDILKKHDIQKFYQLQNSSYSDKIKKLKDDGNKIILFCGTKSNDKGIYLTIEVLKKLILNNENYTLVVCGTNTLAWNIYKFIKLRKYIVQSNIIDVKYISRGELNKIFSLSDIFFLPSRVETLGFVYTEAMYFKLPIIADNSIEELKEIYGDNISYIDNNINDPNNIEQIANEFSTVYLQKTTNINKIHKRDSKNKLDKIYKSII